MYDKFTVEIISPDKLILNSEANEVTIPSYEGQMGILKNHIPLITFLRPGVISIQSQNEKKYFVEEGTVEFSNNNLLILTSTAKDLKELNQNYIEDILNETEKKLSDNNSSDKERYLLSYKINTLKEISQ
jgi:F-type H+-transporting ATPase subunit epsilon